MNKPNIALTINPGKGLGAMLFGSTSDQVEAILGPPNEVEELNEENDHVLIWHYWDTELSIFFDLKNNRLLTCVEISNPEAKLWDQDVFEMSQNEVLELFKKRGYLNPEIEQEAWGETRISYEDAQVDLYFEDGQLIAINYGVFLDDQTLYFFPN